MATAVEKEIGVFYTHGNRVIVIPDEPLSMSPGGIHLPDKVAEKPRTGSLYRLGKKAFEDDPVRPAVGDTLYFSKYAGSEIELNGESYLVLRDEDVLAVVSR